MQIVQIYDARVIDASPTTLLIEATGPETRVDALLNMLKGFGIRELVRTGPVAMMRGSATVSVKEIIQPDREMAVAANGTAAHAN
jgi:acetolactate synthase-1/3 small subunit